MIAFRIIVAKDPEKGQPQNVGGDRNEIASSCYKRTWVWPIILRTLQSFRVRVGTILAIYNAEDSPFCLNSRESTGSSTFQPVWLCFAIRNDPCPESPSPCRRTSQTHACCRRLQSFSVYVSLRSCLSPAFPQLHGYRPLSAEDEGGDIHEVRKDALSFSTRNSLTEAAQTCESIRLRRG